MSTEIFQLKAGENSPEGQSYGKIKAVEWSVFRVT